MRKRKIKLQAQKKGFGLLEVLLSGIIIIIILSALVLVGRAATNNAEYSSERNKAIFLSQEGVEIVRLIRDTNWIDQDSNSEWNDLDKANGPLSENGKTSGCYIVKSDKTSLTNKMFDGTSAQCQSLSDSETINVDGVDYHRSVYVESMPASSTTSLVPNNGSATDVHPDQNAFKVTVFVSWTFGSVLRQIEASEVLTNWRPTY